MPNEKFQEEESIVMEPLLSDSEPDSNFTLPDEETDEEELLKGGGAADDK